MTSAGGQESGSGLFVTSSSGGKSQGGAVKQGQDARVQGSDADGATGTDTGVKNELGKLAVQGWGNESKGSGRI